jgi:D-beta-D-heptose 7-phosphate kinase/D-beta-D-heptose 1-phosphate adenosyltransferase
VRDAQPEVDVMVLSDYAKGVLGGPLCAQCIAAARSAGVKTVIDPKGTDYTRYRGATAITPNRAEAGAATGVRIDGYARAAEAARRLVDAHALECVFVTLDRDGIFVQERGRDGQAIGTDPREVYDVTGAGDNVISVIAYALAGGSSPFTAAALANVAGGIAVEHFGVVTVGWEDIAARIAAGCGGDAKLLDAGLLERLLDSAREAGRKIVFTNGCFDLLHRGHVDLLRRARALGDLLVVGLNDDASVRRLKGETRPVNTITARAEVLGALESVSYLVAFGEDTPEQIIRRVRPDVLVKGEDWKDKGVVGREFVESYGGRVELIPLVPGHSTTSMLERLGGS